MYCKIKLAYFYIFTVGTWDSLGLVFAELGLQVLQLKITIMTNQNNNNRTKWLDQLQEQSWNLELIITGFVLFGLIRLREFLELKEVQFYANEADIYGGGINQATNMYAFFNDFCGLFIFSLLLLIFIRGLWIGAIGLRYVSGDIDFDEFKYHDKFKQHLRQRVGSFDDYIHTLENLSSSILAFTYLMFFVGISLVLYMFEVSLVIELLEELGIGNGIREIVQIILIVLGAIVAFDFLTLGWLKTINIPIFKPLYFGLYRFVSSITLSFLWRPILFNFLDQKYVKWIVLIIPIVIYCLSGDRFSYTDYDYKFFPRLKQSFYEEHMRTAFQPKFYDDLRQAAKEEGNYATINNLSLSNHIIESPIMKVFVKHTKSLDDFIARTDSSILLINNLSSKNRREYSFIKKRPATEHAEYYEEREAAFYEQRNSMDIGTQKDSLTLNFIANEKLAYRDYLTRLKSIIKQYFYFEINQQRVPDSLVHLAFYVHPNLGEKGFICTFPLENVHLGINELTLKRKAYVTNSQVYIEKDFTIPFIYEGSTSPKQENETL